MLTWEVKLGGRVEAEAAPGGEQRPDHLDAAAAAAAAAGGPGWCAGGVALGCRRRGRGGPPERHVAQPQATGFPLLLVLPLAPVPLLLLLRQRKQQQRLAVRVGRRKTYGAGGGIAGEGRWRGEGNRRGPEYDCDGDAPVCVRGVGKKCRSGVESSTQLRRRTPRSE